MTAACAFAVAAGAAPAAAATHASATPTTNATAGRDFAPALAHMAIAGALSNGIVGDTACPNYPYGTTIIPGSQWAGGLGTLTAPDGATFDVKSNWDGRSCVRGPENSDTVDAWGIDYQCTQLAVRAADVEWREGGSGAWAAAGWNGYAYNMYDVAANLPTSLVTIPNGAGVLPNPGDILVWNATASDPSGHVAVVERVDPVNQMVWFVSQNSYYAEYGIPYSGSTLDPTESFGLPLRGWISDPRPARGLALRSDGASGYTFDGWGGVHPFGGAPRVNISDYWPGWDIARGIALRPDGQSGYLIDGFGGIHPFGNATQVYSSTWWPGWDIVRGIVLRPDGASGYVLDGWGGVHAFGGAPAVRISAYWPGWDIARALVLRPDGQSGYVLDGFGGLHPFGGAPAVQVTSYWRGWDIARSVTLAGDGSNPAFPANSGWVLDGWGGVHPFNGAPSASFLTSTYTGGKDIARGIAFSPLNNRGVAVSGTTQPVPFSVGGPGRAVALSPSGTGGYVLDGWGDLTPFGGATALSNVTGHWPNWDIARAVALRPDGVSGWVIDAWGGFHPFGGAPAMAPPQYWQGQDMVRGVVLRPDGNSGYLLDAHGNVWAFGGAPTATAGQTWNTDTARAIALRSDGQSGWVLDAHGNLWPFGGAPQIMGPPSWSGDVARGLAMLTDWSGYVLDREGGLHPFGGAPSVSGPQVWTGYDVARAIVLAPSSTYNSAQGVVGYADGIASTFTSSG